MNETIDMTIVHPSAELIDINKLVNNRFKNEPEHKRKELHDYYSPCEIVMEYIGRICYNSHDAMTSESIDKFLSTAAKKGHRSIFEFGQLLYTTVDDTETVEMIYDILANNKYIKIETRVTDNPDTSILIIKGSPRAFIEILEFFTLDYINVMPVKFYNTLLNKLSVMLPTMVTNWETYDSILALNESIIGEIEDYSTMADITADYANRSDFTKFLVYVTCGRDVTHEIVRHRPVSYMQESQRYIRFDKNNPYKICISPEQEKSIIDKTFDHIYETFKKYTELLKDNRAQDARIILPNCAKTSIFIYTDKEEYRHFFRMRQSKFAYPPIKIVFDQLYQQLIDKKYI